MNIPGLFSSEPWRWIMWVLLAFSGTMGVLAVLSPRLFWVLAAWSRIRIDIDKLQEKLDRQINIDRLVVRHSRLFGILVVLAAALLARHMMQVQLSATWAVWVLLGAVGAVGVMAVLSPRRFSVLAALKGPWINTDRLAGKLDLWFDVDHYFVRHTRLFGVLVVVAVLVLAGFLTGLA